jgi:DNA-directed RNA polymerase subunit F
MTKPEIISETPLSMSEVRESLDKIKEKSTELTFRSGRTHDFLQTLPLSKNSGELGKKIEELNVPRLKPEHIIKIVDLMPKTVDELKIIIQGYTLTVSNENLSKIVNIVKE